jgi:hypothetical protein
MRRGFGPSVPPLSKNSACGQCAYTTASQSACLWEAMAAKAMAAKVPQAWAKPSGRDGGDWRFKPPLARHPRRQTSVRPRIAFYGNLDEMERALSQLGKLSRKNLSSGSSGSLGPTPTKWVLGGAPGGSKTVQSDLKRLNGSLRAPQGVPRRRQRV